MENEEKASEKATPEEEVNAQTAEAPEAPANSETAGAAEPEPAAEPEAAESTAEAAEPSVEPAPEAPKAPDWKNLYALTLADFDNFKKRTARDREELFKSAAADVLKDLLATVDNLSRALEGAADKKDDPFVKGVQLVYDGLVKTLADHGATPIDSLGEPFDANFHEALAHLPSADVEEGRISNEVKRGWLLHGKLLRAAQVVVSAGKGA